MKNRLRIAVATFTLLLAGCVAPTPSEPTVARWHLEPQLSSAKELQIYVNDSRPVVEREKDPSTAFLYTGALFAADKSAETVAMDLGAMAVKFGGAQNYQLASSIPTNGPVIIFTLEHWYSRTALNPKSFPVVVEGEFSGTIVLQRNGTALDSRHVEAKGIPTVVDSDINSESDKRETQKLIARAMEKTANSSQQRAYSKIMDFFQETWNGLSSSE
jgi:hypothetical protein